MSVASRSNRSSPAPSGNDSVNPAYPSFVVRDRVHARRRQPDDLEAPLVPAAPGRGDGLDRRVAAADPNRDAAERPAGAVDDESADASRLGRRAERVQLGGTAAVDAHLEHERRELGAVRRDAEPGTWTVWAGQRARTTRRPVRPPRRSGLTSVGGSPGEGGLGDLAAGTPLRARREPGSGGAVDPPAASAARAGRAQPGHLVGPSVGERRGDDRELHPVRRGRWDGHAAADRAALALPASRRRGRGRRACRSRA